MGVYVAGVFGLVLGVALAGWLIGQRVQRRLREQAERLAEAGVYRQQAEQLPEVQGRLTAVEASLARAETQLEGLRQEAAQAADIARAYADLQVAHGRLQQAFDDYKERSRTQHDDLLAARQELTDRFKSLASDLLKQTSAQANERQREQLQHLLQPFGERLRRFEAQVDQAYRQEGKERHGLLLEIQRLAAQSERMSREADQLTQALKGQSKTRGDWGEVILQRLLEMAGLRQDQEYRIQVSEQDEAGRRFQPDVVVDLPGESCLVIDSKVSLLPWIEACEAEDDAAREQALRTLVAAVGQHVRELGGKGYQRLPGLRTVDFVLLFIPIEAAFAQVMSAAPELYNDALARDVVIVSPTTVLATLRTIALTWRYERQERNALRIAEEAGKLYDQFVLFTTSLEQVGQRLRQAQDAYDQGHRRLVDGRGNLIRRAEGLRDLGVKTAKRLGVAWRDAAEADAPDDDA